jgi:hypothetical protein
MEVTILVVTTAVLRAIRLPLGFKYRLETALAPFFCMLHKIGKILVHDCFGIVFRRESMSQKP